VAIHRLRKARDQVGIDVVFDPRPWPLELINERGVPYHIVMAEASLLASQEPSLFSALREHCRPSTMMPAFELVAAAREVQGTRFAEAVDYGLRVAFFRDSVDISIRSGLDEALSVTARICPEIEADEILEVWESGRVRADVLHDFHRSLELSIQGSPQIFWPDGSTTHNPGMDYRMLRGLPRLEKADADAPRRLLEEKLQAVAS
jgi:hypothetical protein